MRANSGLAEASHSRGALLGVMALSWALSACQEPVSAILSDDSCAAPCWHEITPGQANVHEARRWLTDDLSILAESLGETRMVTGDGLITWTFDQGVAEQTGRIVLSGEVVSTIDITVAGAFTLEDAVAKFGDPESVSVILGMADTRWLLIVLLYPSQGIAASRFDAHLLFSERPQSSLVEIRPEMAVDRAIFFDPARYDELLETRQIIRQSFGNIARSLQPWQGFGKVSYLDLTH